MWPLKVGQGHNVGQCHRSKLALSGKNGLMLTSYFGKYRSGS